MFEGFVSLSLKSVSLALLQLYCSSNVFAAEVASRQGLRGPGPSTRQTVVLLSSGASGPSPRHASRPSVEEARRGGGPSYTLQQ